MTRRYRSRAHRIAELEARTADLERKLGALYRGIEIVGETIGREFVPPREQPRPGLRVVK